MANWITVHDADVSPKNKKWPEGRPVRVRADAISTIRPYQDGRARTVLGINGSYLHTTETEDEILEMIGGVLQ